jgi:hypothetical protein
MCVYPPVAYTPEKARPLKNKEFIVQQVRKRFPLLNSWIDAMKDSKEIPKVIHGYLKEVPKSTLKKLLKKLESFIQEYSKTFIEWGNVEERLELASKYFPSKFKDCTAIINGTHIRCHKKYHPYYSSDSFYSYKLKGWAVSFQVVLSPENKVIWIDNGQPAGVHDYRCVWRSDLERKVDFKKDKIIGDLSENSLFDPIP